MLLNSSEHVQLRNTGLGELSDTITAVEQGLTDHLAGIDSDESLSDVGRERAKERIRKGQTRILATSIRKQARQYEKFDTDTAKELDALLQIGDEKDQLQLASASQYLRSAKPKLASLISGGDPTLLRASVILTGLRHTILDNKPDSIARVEEAIAVSSIGEAGFTAFKTNRARLNLVNQLHAKLTEVSK